jgi:hypothetical protein
LITAAIIPDGLFRVVVEAVEEAIVNSLFGAVSIIGCDDHVAPVLTVDEVRAICQQAIARR